MSTNRKLSKLCSHGFTVLQSMIHSCWCNVPTAWAISRVLPPWTQQQECCLFLWGWRSPRHPVKGTLDLWGFSSATEIAKNRMGRGQETVLGESKSFGLWTGGATLCPWKYVQAHCRNGALFWDQVSGFPLLSCTWWGRRWKWACQHTGSSKTRGKQVPCGWRRPASEFCALSGPWLVWRGVVHRELTTGSSASSTPGRIDKTMPHPLWQSFWGDWVCSWQCSAWFGSLGTSPECAWGSKKQAQKQHIWVPNQGLSSGCGEQWR